MSEYISIADFARLANVTTQSIYQRLGKDLAPYCKVVGKLKTIDRQALSLYRENLSYQDTKEDFKVITNEPSENDNSCKLIGSDCSDDPTKLESYLQVENERLVKEIEKLQIAIEKKDAQIADFADKFANLASREQEISARALQVGQVMQTEKILQVDETPESSAKKRTGCKESSGIKRRATHTPG